MIAGQAVSLRELEEALGAGINRLVNGMAEARDRLCPAAVVGHDFRSERFEIRVGSGVLQCLLKHPSRTFDGSDEDRADA